MKWVRTPHGEKCHCVASTNDGRTLCGASLKGCTITRPGDDDRCSVCDRLWREKGRLNKPAPRVKKMAERAVEYEPRFTFQDWETQR